MMRSIYDGLNGWLLRIDQTKPPTNFRAIRLENTISALISVKRRGRRQVLEGPPLDTTGVKSASMSQTAEFTWLI